MIGIIASSYSQSLVNDAEAFINAAGITDETQISAITTLVASLKSNSLWNKMKAIYPFVGGSEASHKFNLKDPRDLDAAFRLTFHGTFTHSETGIMPSASYANTYLAQSAHLGQNDIHFSVYSRTNATARDGASIGNNSGGGQNQSNLWLRTTGGLYMRASSTNSAAISDNTDTTGYYIVNRVSGTEVRCMKNSTLLTQTVSSTTNNITGYFALFADKINGSFKDNKQLAFATIGLGLTDTDMSNLYTAVQAFQTTLGRQV